MSELSGVRREAARRAHQIYSLTQGEISRRLSPLKRKTVWREAQSRVTEHSGILCQEGIELA
jgi:DNA-binding transcriptional regulator YdaS (Cro superfamily)